MNNKVTSAGANRTIIEWLGIVHIFQRCQEQKQLRLDLAALCQSRAGRDAQEKRRKSYGVRTSASVSGQAGAVTDR